MHPSLPLLRDFRDPQGGRTTCLSKIDDPIPRLWEVWQCFDPRHVDHPSSSSVIYYFLLAIFFIQKCFILFLIFKYLIYFSITMRNFIMSVYRDLYEKFLLSRVVYLLDKDIFFEFKRLSGQVELKLFTYILFFYIQE